MGKGTLISHAGVDKHEKVADLGDKKYFSMKDHLTIHNQMYAQK